MSHQEQLISRFDDLCRRSAGKGIYTYSGFCGISRSKTTELFRAGKVFVNGEECHSKDRLVKEKDSGASGSCISINVEGCHFYDLAVLMDKQGVAV